MGGNTSKINSNTVLDEMISSYIEQIQENSDSTFITQNVVIDNTAYVKMVSDEYLACLDISKDRPIEDIKQLCIPPDTSVKDINLRYLLNFNNVTDQQIQMTQETISKMLSTTEASIKQDIKGFSFSNETKTNINNFLSKNINTFVKSVQSLKNDKVYLQTLTVKSGNVQGITIDATINYLNNQIQKNATDTRLLDTISNDVKTDIKQSVDGFGGLGNIIKLIIVGTISIFIVLTILILVLKSRKH